MSKIDRISTPQYEPGFLGNGHLGKWLFTQEDFQLNDPFIIFSDDKIHLDGGNPVGGPHPHGGFETVTLILEGELTTHDRQGVKILRAGDLQWMTAGSGVIHAEEIAAKTDFRALQLWLTLPRKQRRMVPQQQNLPAHEAPESRTSHGVVKLYSGRSGELVSPIRNQVPVHLVDLTVHPGQTLTHEIPARYNGFMYVLHGPMAVGGTMLPTGAIGWIDPVSDQTALALTAGNAGARAVLYAGKRQNNPIVAHGPFIGDTRDDIVAYYQKYREGQLQHIREYT